MIEGKGCMLRFSRWSYKILKQEKQVWFIKFKSIIISINYFYRKWPMRMHWEIHEYNNHSSLPFQLSTPITHFFFKSLVTYCTSQCFNQEPLFVFFKGIILGIKLRFFVREKIFQVVWRKQEKKWKVIVSHETQVPRLWKWILKIWYQES